MIVDSRVCSINDDEAELCCLNVIENARLAGQKRYWVLGSIGLRCQSISVFLEFARDENCGSVFYRSQWMLLWGKREMCIKKEYRVTFLRGVFASVNKRIKESKKVTQVFHSIAFHIRD
jgi:hypothetical protein